MFDPHVVLTVLALYVAIVVSPGPNFALISKLALRGDKTTAWGATLGLACAATFYAILAMAGLSVVLERIGWLSRGIQMAGGLYLIWLGIKSWRNAGTIESHDETHGVKTAHGRATAFLRGLRLGGLVNLSNPKGIVFFVSLYAVAVPPDVTGQTQATILAASFAVEIIWYGLVISLLSSAPARAAYARAAAWIERVIGVVLVVFGTKLATSHD